jgi:hypothetical protein
MPAAELSETSLIYAVMVVTFPDGGMYLATHWLHGDAGAVGVIKPVNTLDVNGEDLIDWRFLKRADPIPANLDG